MKLTPAARALLDALQAAVPDQAAAIEGTAIALAVADGSRVVKRGHVEGAVMLADDRFIGEGEEIEWATNTRRH